MTSRLPEFEQPPVVEVAISLQFKSLESLRSPHFGLLWDAFRSDGYSRIEEHAELEPAFEEFETSPTPKVGIRGQSFDDAPPPSRIWFLNEPLNELIQGKRARRIVMWLTCAQGEQYAGYIRL